MVVSPTNRGDDDVRSLRPENLTACSPLGTCIGGRCEVDNPIGSFCHQQSDYFFDTCEPNIFCGTDQSCGGQNAQCRTDGDCVNRESGGCSFRESQNNTCRVLTLRGNSQTIARPAVSAQSLFPLETLARRRAESTPAETRDARLTPRRAVESVSVARTPVNARVVSPFTSSSSEHVKLIYHPVPLPGRHLLTRRLHRATRPRRRTRMRFVPRLMSHGFSMRWTDVCAILDMRWRWDQLHVIISMRGWYMHTARHVCYADRRRKVLRSWCSFRPLFRRINLRVSHRSLWWRRSTLRQ